MVWLLLIVSLGATTPKEIEVHQFESVYACQWAANQINETLVKLPDASTAMAQCIHVGD